MTEAYHIDCPDKIIEGIIRLDGSKSISNRILIIEALSGKKFDISGLSSSHDTLTLRNMLLSDSMELDAGHAGTSFRFSTAYQAVRASDEITLTGSARMKQRPIGPLVEALRRLGANIRYLGEEGFPPLRISPTNLKLWQPSVEIAAHMSSQYISALLMIGPILPNGLLLELKGDVVSRPYIEMTIKLMLYFGAEVLWNGNKIQISNQGYQPRRIQVEADWSAASYYYSIAAFSDKSKFELKGLHENSLQGDQKIKDFLAPIGIKTEFVDDRIIITKSGALIKDKIYVDFTDCPDIAQTMVVIAAGNKIPMQCAGLQTLAIKETDRILAIQTELAKINCSFEPISEDQGLPYPKRRYLISGTPIWNESPTFETFEDHRMAMAFAPLGLIKPIQIKNPSVVRKSYPGFWRDLNTIGFKISKVLQ